MDIRRLKPPSMTIDQPEIDQALVELTADLHQAALAGRIHGMLAVFEHQSGKISVARGGTATEKPGNFQAALTQLMIDNSIYPDQYYIVRGKQTASQG